MNICIKDIYLIILSLIVLYLLYSKIYDKNEKFQNTTTGYQADVEAIRNLSSIATQLTTNNQLTIPGALNITGYLRTNGPTNAVPTIIVLTSGSNINWIIPSGVFRCKVTCIGAGGGGSGGASLCKGGGGGGGGLCIKVFNNLTPGGNATYTIGVGGAGGDGANWGAAGGNTSFTWSGISITANGGGGGQYRNGTSNHGTSAEGGQSINGDINIKGGGGSCGQTINTSYLQGMSNGGNSPLGYGFGGVDPVSNLNLLADGNNGTGYGGGGSGGYAYATAKGGNGSNGAIIIEY